jgi:hypothetical protein
MIFILKKIRFFLDTKSQFAQKIEEEILGIKHENEKTVDRKTIPLKTSDCIVFLKERDQEARWNKYSSIYLLYLLYAFEVIVILTLLLRELHIL